MELPNADYKTKTKLILPFEDTWTVFSGGRLPKENFHRRSDGKGPLNQIYALDFTQEHKGKGEKLEDYNAFGEKVLAPGKGEVIQVVDGCLDMPVGEGDPFVITGNYIMIDHLNGEYSFLAHFKYNSIKVSVGDKIKQGDLLGLCGNTGNSTEPHIHYHLQDNAILHKGIGLPILFSKIKVNNTVKSNVELKRGQEVSNI